MKYNVMKKKIQRIEKVFKYEIRSGKCTREDINFILDTLRGTLDPWDPNAVEEESSLKEKLQLKWAELGLTDDSAVR